MSPAVILAAEGAACLAGLLLLSMMLGCAAGAGHGYLSTLRQTFVPLTKREFWLPPCPLCWVARAAVLVVLVVVATRVPGVWS